VQASPPPAAAAKVGAIGVPRMICCVVSVATSFLLL
jgi:hypothetical protein